MDLFSLYASIGLKDDGFKKGIQEATGEGKKFSVGMTDIIGGVAGLKAVQAAWGMIASSIGGAVSRYDTLNRFPVVMGQMGFSSELAAKSVQVLTDGIQGLPTSLDGIVASTQSLALLTGDLEGATDTALALNNAFLASGAGAADASRGMIQYTQMLSKGTVDMQSWRTLQETMGYALRETAAAFGYAGEAAVSDLYSALQSGDITFTEFNAKLVELSNNTGGFAEVALTASGGIATAYSNMQIAVVRGVTSVIESVDEATESLGGIEGIMKSAGKGFESFLKQVAKGAANLKPLVKNMDVLAVSTGAAMAAFGAYKIITSFVKAQQAATKAVAAANFAQQAYTASLAKGNAVETLANAMKMKSATSEGIRMAAKKAGMEVDKEGTLVTAAGTAVTELEAAALLKSTAAVSAKTVVTQFLSGQIDFATAKTLLWNAAMNANPIGIVVTAVAVLAGGVALLAKAYNDANPSLEKQNELLAQARGEYDGLTAEAETTKEELKEINKRINEINYSAPLSIADEEELEKLVAQREELESIVALLNEQAKSAKQKLAKDTVKALNTTTGGWIKVADGTMRYDSSVGTLMDKLPGLYTAFEHFNKLLEEATIAENADDVEYFTEQLDAIQDEIIETSLELGVHAEALEGVGEEYEGTRDAVLGLIDSSVEFIGVMGEEEGALSGVTGAVETMGETTVRTVGTIGAALHDLEGIQKEALGGMVSAFDIMSSGLDDLTSKIERDNNTTWEMILENQENVIAETEVFTGLYTQLIQEGVSESYLNAIGATGPESIPLLEQMLNSGIDTVKQAENRWEMAGKGVASSLTNAFELDPATAMALQNYILGESGIMGSLKSAVEAADFGSIGTSVGEGYAEGVTDSSDGVDDATRGVVESGARAAKEAQQSNSPSLLYAGLGKDAADGYIKGVEDNAIQVNNAMKELINGAYAAAEAQVVIVNFAGIGLMIAQEIATGVAEGSGMVAQAVVSAVNTAKAAALSAADMGGISGGAAYSMNSSGASGRGGGSPINLTQNINMVPSSPYETEQAALRAAEEIRWK